MVHAVTSQGVYTYETQTEPPDESAYSDVIIRKNHQTKTAHISYRNPEMNRIPGAMRSLNFDIGGT